MSQRTAPRPWNLLRWLGGMSPPLVLGASGANRRQELHHEHPHAAGRCHRIGVLGQPRETSHLRNTPRGNVLVTISRRSTTALRTASLRIAPPVPLQPWPTPSPSVTPPSYDLFGSGSAGLGHSREGLAASCLIRGFPFLPGPPLPMGHCHAELRRQGGVSAESRAPTSSTTPVSKPNNKVKRRCSRRAARWFR